MGGDQMLELISSDFHWKSSKAKPVLPVRSGPSSSPSMWPIRVFVSARLVFYV